MLRTIDLGKTVFDGISKTGGFTLWTNESERENGFVVSSIGHEQTVNIYQPNEYVIEQIRKYIRDHYTLGDCIGFWIDEDLLYMDVNDWIPDFNTAIHEGAKRGQLAIYDIAEQESIYLESVTKVA